MIEKRKEEDVLILTPDIEKLTLENATSSRKAFEEFFSKEAFFAEEKRVILDLHKLSSIDSAGLSTLLAIGLSLHLDKKSLLLVISSPEVIQLLSMTHVDRYFSIETTLEGALRAFSSSKAAAMSPLSPKEEIVEKLHEQYRRTIASKIESIKGSFSKLKESSSKANTLELISLLHKIAGSAGSYGYIEAGKTAKEIELALESAVDGESLLPLPYPKLQIQIETLELQFTPPFCQSTKKRHAALSKTCASTALLLSEDKTLFTLFDQAAKALSMQITCEEDPEKSISTLKSMNAPPSLIILEENYLHSRLSGIAIVKKIQEEIANPNISFLLIAKEEEISLHLQAIELGIQTILKKPISEKTALSVLQKYHKKGSDQRKLVLIVDDDPDICKLIKTSLDDINVDTKTLNDETKILQTLFEGRPDLLLLDIHMQKYDGWALLQVIRNDARYSSLGIIIITSSDAHLYQRALSSGANDILIKPFTPEKIQKKVLSFIEKSSQTIELPENHSFLDVDAFLTQSLAIVQEKSPTPCFLLLIAIENYEAASELGKGANEELLVTCRNLIDLQFQEALLQGETKEGLFLILLSPKSREETEHQLDLFIDQNRYRLRAFSAFSQGETIPILHGKLAPCPLENMEPLIKKEMALFTHEEFLPTKK